MKLNFGRRLVLFIHWLLSLAIVALGVAMFVWPECRATAAQLMQKTDVFIYAIAVLVVYLLFAAGAVGIACGGKKRGPDHGFIIVDSSETGRTRIAVGAVEQMIRQAVRGVSGIAEMRANIVNGEDAITVNVDATLLNGAHVPTVTANIRRAIRGYIEQNCGVAVRGVSVNVHSLADAEPAGGKRGRKKKTEVGDYVNPTLVGNSYTGYAVPDGDASNPLERTATIPVVPVMERTEAAPAQSEPAEPPCDPVPAEEPAPAEEIPAAVEDAPTEEPKPKKGLFGKLFGKRKDAAPDAEAPAPEPEPEVPKAEDIEVEEPYAAAESAAEDDAALEGEPAPEEIANDPEQTEVSYEDGEAEDRDGAV